MDDRGQTKEKKKEQDNTRKGERTRTEGDRSIYTDAPQTRVLDCGGFKS